MGHLCATAPGPDAALERLGQAERAMALHAGPRDARPGDARGLAGRAA
jgi:hypothetical protein